MAKTKGKKVKYTKYSTFVRKLEAEFAKIQKMVNDAVPFPGLEDREIEYAKQSSLCELMKTCDNVIENMGDILGD